jgi:hypothetical protein
MSKLTTCPACGGSGNCPCGDCNKPCYTCNATGQVAAEQPECECGHTKGQHYPGGQCVFAGCKSICGTPPTEARELEGQVKTVLLAYGLNTVSELAEANGIKALTALITTEANRLAGERVSRTKVELTKELRAIFHAKREGEPMFDFAAVLDNQIEAFEKDLTTYTKGHNHDK